MNEFTENDCCGNGCMNCVLDIKPLSFRCRTSNKKNIIENYTSWTLQSKTPHNRNLSHVLELHFSCCEDVNTNEYELIIPPGHHIMMKTNIAGAIVLRPYSPFWTNCKEMEFKILVNLEGPHKGPMSKYIEKLRVGDKVEFRGPIGSYNHDPPKTLFIVTQGVAVSPSIPVVNAILDNEDDMSRIYHLACFRDLSHLYFRDTLQEFNKFWNYKGFMYLAHQRCEYLDCCINGFTSDCPNFKNKIRYKERVVTQKLRPEDLEELVLNVTDYPKVFIVSGTREFQNWIFDIISTMEDVCKDNIFLL